MTRAFGFGNALKFNLAFCAATVSAFAAAPARSTWVSPGSDGKLVYRATPAGDRIMDFSYAGYMGGGVALPDVPVKITVKPSGGADDTKAIQEAIDRVAAMPLNGGFRGAIQLAPGTFNCTSTLNVSTSGIVLRGSGSAGAGRSTLQLTGSPHNAIAVRGSSSSRDRSATRVRARTTIADAYVGSGASSFTVVDAKGFAVGDTLHIERPVTEAWVEFMRMHDLTRDGKPQTWMRTGSTTAAERRIVAIAGNRFTLDVPLSDSFDGKYLNPPGTAVLAVEPPSRVQQVGIERLHIESPPQEISHTAGHFTALRLTGEDCWVRDVVIDETMNSVAVGGRRITLERVTVNRKAKHQGASKPAEFAPNGTQVLLDRCAVNADNVWFVATGAGVSGPMVALNCDFRGNGRAESHQRWSTGMLYDNCRAPDGGIELRNRGAMGSGHGWSMGWGVIWNCTTKEYLIQNPPGALNWLIGSTGHSGVSPRPFGSGPNLAVGTEDAHGTRVAPASLYLAQLQERLGPQALANIGYGPGGATIAGAASTSRLGAALPAENLAIDRPVLTSNMRGGDRRFGGWQALDRNLATYWATDDGVTNATLELDTEGAVEANAIELVEAVPGQVKRYRVEGFTDSAWRLLAEGTTIGDRKRHRFPRVTVWKLKLTILEAVPYAAIGTLGLYLETSPTS
ncbi:MAG: hypothetical protein Q7S40_06410 [Opitutaceae bacterium]|nr:hypothetical protein [Opitutaceae bacterium]